MSPQHVAGWTRRRVLSRLTLAGTAGLLGLCPRLAAAEPPPEVRTIRLVKIPAICFAPLFVAEELLRLEGFSEVEYVPRQVTGSHEMLSANQADFTMDAPPDVLPSWDAGKRLTVVAGIHGGCYELFAHERVQAIRDLKGKRVAVSGLKGSEYYFTAAMLAYVGINPRTEVEWVDAHGFDAMMQAYLDGQADAFLAFPPQPQQLRARGIGRVILNTAQDSPWKQYFCCMLVARQEFVVRHPIATKRAVRALLKASDLCAREPERAASDLVAKGYEPDRETALDVLKSLSYDRWRRDSVEDSLRFYALRLHEGGMIKINPNTLIARGTDWRFLNELKQELKS
jgi:NitT/TauT family transport system substrate-binding protein